MGGILFSYNQILIYRLAHSRHIKIFLEPTWAVVFSESMAIKFPFVVFEFCHQYSNDAFHVCFPSKIMNSSPLLLLKSLPVWIINCMATHQSNRFRWRPIYLYPVEQLKRNAWGVSYIWNTESNFLSNQPESKAQLTHWRSHLWCTFKI